MIYEAQCTECDKYHLYHAKLENCDDVPVCPACGAESRKVFFTAPTSFVKGRFEAYKSQVDGTIIRSHKDLEEHNKRNGVVLLNDGYSEETISSGSMARKQEELKKEDLITDMQEAIHDLENGYKPEKQDADITIDAGWSTTVEVPNE